MPALECLRQTEVSVASLQFCVFVAHQLLLASFFPLLHMIFPFYINKLHNRCSNTKHSQRNIQVNDFSFLENALNST